MVKRNGAKRTQRGPRSGNRELRPQLQRAVSAMLGHSTVKAAAESIGIGETTLLHWYRTNQEFSAAVHAASRDHVGQAITRLRVMCGLAVDTMESGMLGNATAAQIAAARGVLDYIAKLDDRERQMQALQNLSVRMLMWYSGIVEQHVQDPATRAAIKRDFLALSAPAEAA